MCRKAGAGQRKANQPKDTSCTRQRGPEQHSLSIGTRDLTGAESPGISPNRKSLGDKTSGYKEHARSLQSDEPSITENRQHFFFTAFSAIK